MIQYRPGAVDLQKLPLRESTSIHLETPLSPPLAGGDEGEGEYKWLKSHYIITPTFILPRRGGGSFRVSGWTLIGKSAETIHPE